MSAIYDKNQLNDPSASSVTTKLVALGVTGLPDVTTVTRLRTFLPPRPTFDGPLLSADLDALGTYMLQLAEHAAAESKMNDAQRIIVAELETEISDALRAAQDNIVAQLVALWQPHVDAAKYLADAGVLPSYTAEQLLDFPSEVQQAWKVFPDTHTKPLISIAAARVALARHLGAPPFDVAADVPAFMRNPDVGLLLTDPWSYGAFADDGPSLTRAVWIQYANVLGMPQPSTLTTVDSLEANQTPGAARILQTARARMAATE